MPRIACLVVCAAIAPAMAGLATAAPRHEHRHSSSAAHHHSHSTAVAASAFRPAAVLPVAVGYFPAYSPSSYPYRQPLTFSRSAVPPAYYMAMSSNAAPLTFTAPEDRPGWNWQRVSLHQIDAEVRARRAAQNPAKAPSHRQYCPDSRAYYPEVTRCNSEWLTVVATSPAGAAAQPLVASR